jgi:GT2 family glycosyltransferase
MSYGVIIPNRYPDIIQPLIQSIKEWEQAPTKIVVVSDGHQDGYGFESVPYDREKFCYSRAINIGFDALGDLDAILLNDDCVLVEPNTFQRLDRIASREPMIGILSPLIRGGIGNKLQSFHEYKKHWDPEEEIRGVYEPDPVCFPCVHIKRNLIDNVGPMDESITGYGGDDNEYCSRARGCGWITAVTSKVVVQHGDGKARLGDGRGFSWNLSFMRKYGIVSKLPKS